MLATGWDSDDTPHATTYPKHSQGECYSEDVHDVDGYVASEGEEDRFLQHGEYEDHRGLVCKSRTRPTTTRIASAIGIGVTSAVFWTWPFPHTVPIFLGLLSGLTIWTALESLILVWCYLLLPPRAGKTRWSLLRRFVYLGAVCSILFFASLGFRPPTLPVPEIRRADPAVPEKYLIAAAAYNCESIFPMWTSQLIKLAQHLGPENVFISVIESYSDDRCPSLLQDDFVARLDEAGISHRIQTGFATWKAKSSDPAVPATTTGIYRSWPYAVSPERIRYLAEIRNAALAPLSSSDPIVRLADYEEYTKIIFLNDIYFDHLDIVRLIATRLDGDNEKASDADLVCGTDFGYSGKSIPRVVHMSDT